ncbi:hypothetical protein F4677DRAFT_2770 [Hypoxylon crocopeplum]|nr:hypothetical protein F4677DRAFT_2770 [Hypoxylon crocopeplum]
MFSTLHYHTLSYLRIFTAFRYINPPSSHRQQTTWTTLLQEARDRFLHHVESRTPKCQVHEIQGSGSDIVYSEKTMHMNEVQLYLRKDPGQPCLRLIKLEIDVLARRIPQPQQNLAWVPDMAPELGIDVYDLGNIPSFTAKFLARECPIHGEGNVFKFYGGVANSFIIASYNSVTGATTCLLLKENGKHAAEVYRYMTGFLNENRALFQSYYFLPLLLLASRVEMGASLLMKSFYGDTRLIDEKNITDWEFSRDCLRWAQHYFNYSSDVAKYLREQLDTLAEQGASDMLPKDVAAGHTAIREAISILEPTIAPNIWK